MLSISADRAALVDDDRHATESAQHFLVLNAMRGCFARGSFQRR